MKGGKIESANPPRETPIGLNGDATLPVFSSVIALLGMKQWLLSASTLNHTNIDITPDQMSGIFAMILNQSQLNTT